MTKRAARRTPDSGMATAGAVAHAVGNQTAVNLHAWANQPGMPDAHTPEAHHYYHHLQGHAPTREVDASQRAKAGANNAADVVPSGLVGIACTVGAVLEPSGSMPLRARTPW